MELTIRPALPTDLDFAFAMMTAAGRGMVQKYLGCGSQSKAYKLFTRLWSGGANQFHYRNAWIAASDGVRLGFLSVYEKGSGPLSSLNIPQLIWYGGLGFVGYHLRHLGGMLDSLSLPEGRPGELYIAALASAPSSRGQGIGSRLLDHAISLARDLGRRYVSLIVAKDNPGAGRLYERYGFRVDDSRQARHRLVRRMVLDIGEAL